MTFTKLRIDSKKLERAAYVLKAVAHPTRIGIIDLLDQRTELSVTELCDLLQCEQSLISHHLINMRDKGLLGTRRDGKNIYYFLVDKTITNIIECINGCEQF
ncbi:MAG TPA: metalloregulator ArsR/SmtB family transcription factor [Cytophagales bacterium]|nr:metalloregulator ArsR/SmtB family transcription factor [Cytophagales bacterium]